MNTLAAHAVQAALIAASHQGSERARAVSALRGAEVYATTWPGDPSSLRTLLNSAGVLALAVFTDERQLEDAAVRFAWLGVDGAVPTRRLHISEAIRFARQQRVSLVVLDITSDHAFELDEGELELMSALPSTRPPSYAGLAPVVTARHVDVASDVKRASTRPPPPLRDVHASDERTSAVPSHGHTPTAINIDVEHHAVSATFGLAHTATMTALRSQPDDELIDSLALVLRDYPEVEWACLVGELDSDVPGAVHVAVRVDAAFRKHLGEISVKLRAVSAAAAGANQGAPCDVLVLDTPEQMKRARSVGLPFYPWKKRESRV